MATQIKLRRDTYQNWYDNNPVLGQGEPGYDITNKKLKIGDGLTLWRALSYFDDQVTVTDRLANGTNEVILDANGTLTVPYPSSDSFRIRLSSENFVPREGKATLTLTGDPWDFYGAFANSQDGTQRELAADNGPLPSLTNPGYEDGDTFEIDSTAHGIVGYTLTVTLSDVIQAGPAGWTANLAFSPAPSYTSTIKSLGAVKLTANTNSLILGTDGTVTVSGAIKQGISKLAFNENGGTNVYLTPTTDDSTAVFINDISVQAYAKQSVSLQVGSGLAVLEQNWIDAEQLYADIRNQDAALISPATRSWAGLPSYQAYDIILNTIDPTPPIPPNLVPAANAAKNSYNNWQNTKEDTFVGIVVGDKVWMFNPDGELTAQADSTIKTTTGNLQITAGNYLQLNSTDFGQVEIGRYQAGGVVVLGGTNTLTEVDGTLKVNDNIRQNNTTIASPNSVNVPGATPTTVFTAPSYFTSIKLVIAVEGRLDGDGANVDHTQTCEATIAATYNTSADPIMSVYGVVYTSPAPLATFTVARNGLSGAIEVTAVNSQTTNAMNVRVHAIQFVSRYD